MLTKSLLSVAAFTALAGVWFITMDLTMKHAGYEERVWMAGFFCVQALATIIAFAAPSNRALRLLTLPGALVIAYTGAHVWLFVFRGDREIEGYVLLMALALVIQAALTIACLFQPVAITRTA
jgi:ABC-type amino acid transport substrate-binding protein